MEGGAPSWAVWSGGVRSTQLGGLAAVRGAGVAPWSKAGSESRRRGAQMVPRGRCGSRRCRWWPARGRARARRPEAVHVVRPFSALGQRAAAQRRSFAVVVPGPPRIHTADSLQRKNSSPRSKQHTQCHADDRYDCNIVFAAQKSTFKVRAFRVHGHVHVL